MDELQIKLRCTACQAFREFERVSKNVVRCAGCGKRHSTDSLHAVSEDEAADSGA